MNNPFTHAYRMLKCSAKNRGIPFSLTKQQFKKFCDETGYLMVKGKRSSDQTVDRIDNNKGYEDGNIQMLSSKSNIQKFREELEQKLDEAPREEENPF